jgi:nitrite reductase/ring-hydroxylating ferredoxin subunit
MTSMPRHVVAKAAELPPGTRKLVQVGERAIVVLNVKGELFALSDKCPHRGGSLSLGKLTGAVSSSRPGSYDYSRPGEILRCPWHGWEFDIRTGQSWFDPARVRVRRYAVTVEGEPPGADQPAPPDGLTPGPYVAETYPVAVERRHVVVDVPA